LTHRGAARRQLSVLRVLERVLADAGFRARRAAAEVLRFAAGVVRRLLARLANADGPEPARTPAPAASGGESAGAPAAHAGRPRPSPAVANAPMMRACLLII